MVASRSTHFPSFQLLDKGLLPTALVCGQLVVLLQFCKGRQGSTTPDSTLAAGPRKCISSTSPLAVRRDVSIMAVYVRRRPPAAPAAPRASPPGGPSCTEPCVCPLSFWPALGPPCRPAPTSRSCPR